MPIPRQREAEKRGVLQSHCLFGKVEAYRDLVRATAADHSASRESSPSWPASPRPCCPC